jgi:hypothetical protein
MRLPILCSNIAMPFADSKVFETEHSSGASIPLLLARRQWKDRRPIPGEALAERGRPAYMGVGSGENQ